MEKTIQIKSGWVLEQKGIGHGYYDFRPVKIWEDSEHADTIPSPPSRAEVLEIASEFIWRGGYKSEFNLVYKVWREGVFSED